MGRQLDSWWHKRGLCAKKHGLAMKNLSLWIGSCVHYIRDQFSENYSFNKAFDSVEDPWLCCCCRTQPYRSRGECRSVCRAHSGRLKSVCLIWSNKGEELSPLWLWLDCDWSPVFSVTDYWMHSPEFKIVNTSITMSQLKGSRWPLKLFELPPICFLMKFL